MKVASEQAICVALVSRPDSHWLLGKLSAAMFTQDFYRWVFQTAASLQGKGQPVDVITMTEQVPADRQQEVLQRLVELANQTCVPANLPTYIANVRDDFKLRRIQQICHQFSELASEKPDPQELMDKLISEVSKAALGGNAEAVSFGDAMDSAIAEMQEIADLRAQGGLAGLPTGLPLLDARMGGLPLGRMGVFPGRPGWGKTALMLQCATHAAKRGHPGAILSIEMPKEDCVKRAVCCFSGLDYGDTLQGKTLAKFRKERDNFASISLHIDDCSSRIGDIVARAHELKHRHGIQHFWVDYLGLIDGSDRKEHRRQLGDYTRQLKMLSKELNIFVGVLVQLSRSCEIEGRRPRMSDLADAADIERDSDFILCPRPTEAPRGGVQRMEFGWIKSRICAKGWSSTPFEFDGRIQRFRELSAVPYGMEAA